MCALLALARLCAASFSIPSLGLETAAGVRAGLRDGDFRINFSRGTRIETANYTVAIADLANFPALGAQDVQMTVIRVSVKAGRELFTHLHPRASETVTLLRGTSRVAFTFEGLGDARRVSNVLRKGESTVFPQGLVHETSCISKKDCVFLAFLNSADPGIVPVSV